MFMKSMNNTAIVIAATLLTLSPVSRSAKAQCSADVNDDHIVDGLDLASLLSAWGTSGVPGGTDVNGDGSVDGLDLTFVLSGWGVCPGPSWATVLEATPDAAVVTNATLRNAIAASGLPWRVRDNASNIEMLLVPEGTFIMGCSASAQFSCSSNETPLHQVILSAFYIGRYEVTQAQWTATMGSNPSSFSGYSDSPSRPVERVSWNMITGSGGFNSATGLRLPTEAEWEYAYRAGTTTAFHSYPQQPNGFNDDTLLGNIAWFSNTADSQTHAVGGKFGNGLGLHDMSGNVWEWCQDYWSYGYYASSPITNPTGPATGSSRLLRGGVWGSSPNDCRASQRNNYSPEFGNNVGFRVVRNP